MSGAIPAGSRVEYHVTFLEMGQRPDYDWPSQPAGGEGALLRAEKPPLWYFLALYDAVGRDYAWEDLHTTPDAETDAETDAWLARPEVALYTFLQRGWPHGFFVLDATAPDTCELAYFGLVPEIVGHGFGTWLLRTAILTAWGLPGIRKLTVNTCSLDHPRALALYQKNGFVVATQRMRTRILTRERDPARIPD